MLPLLGKEFAPRARKSGGHATTASRSSAGPGSLETESRDISESFEYFLLLFLFITHLRI